MKNKLFDAIGQLPEQRIEEAVSIDSEEKLQARVRREKQSRLRKVLLTALPAACICIVLAAVLLPTLLRGGDPLVKVVSPITEMGSVSELGNVLGVGLPVPESKKTARCQLYSAGGQPYKGEITFTDGTVLAVGMPSGSEDISGIYGGTPAGSADIRGITVRYFYYSGTGYAVFTHDGRPYCYYVYKQDEALSAENITDAIGADVQYIIDLILDNKNERNSK